MSWIKILLIVLAFIGHIIVGYSVPYIKNKIDYEKVKEFYEIIKEKESKDD